MPNITSLELNLQTARVDGAGTDGDVYLGFCGREFYVDSEDEDFDDFESGDIRTYIFGDGANVIQPDLNDPREPQLLSENIDRFPVYIRFEPEDRDDNWRLQRAVVTFNGNLFPMWDTAELIRGAGGIWIGTRAGLFVHFIQHQEPGAPPA
jgi:hypothetical protein